MEKLSAYSAAAATGTVEQLREWEAAGMTYAIVYFQEAAYDLSGLDLFARDVIPALW